MQQRLALYTAPLLALTCQRQVVAPEPTTPPTQQEPEPTAAARPPLARTVELAPAAWDRAFSTLGYDMSWLDEAPIPVTELPYRDVVVFKIDGVDYCRAFTPEADHERCEPTAGIGGHYVGIGEFLGFAILSFRSPAQAVVEHVRLVDEAPFGRDTQCQDCYFPNAEPGDFHADPDKGWISNNRRHLVESLSTADVDGDGQPEIIAVVAVEEFDIIDYYYYQCEEDPDCPDLADPDAFAATAYKGRRLLILRDNLTLQLDISLDERGFTVFDGQNYDSDVRINHTFAIEHGSVVAQWCALEFGLHASLSDCEVELACAEPTVRVRWHYDPESDAYAKAEVERLRPNIDDVDEFAELCPP